MESRTAVCEASRLKAGTDVDAVVFCVLLHDDADHVVFLLREVDQLAVSRRQQLPVFLVLQLEQSRRVRESQAFFDDGEVWAEVDVCLG